ncbi:MAG: flavin reductase family protein [Candidatus Omnitrophica bacterium]|nr:flavin reductase family protein [Candidatus Omnitrophota bacterium]
MKVEISQERATRLLSSGNVILATSAYKDRSNIITLAWKTPLSHKPPLVGISIAKSHFSCELVEKSEEFVINIPDVNLLEKVVFCGKVSGRDTDKFKETELTPIKAHRLINAPLISECMGNLECYLRDIREFGDHKLFVGEIIYAQAEENLFDQAWDVDKIRLIYHLGGIFFTSSDKMIKVK